MNTNKQELINLLEDLKKRNQEARERIKDKSVTIELNNFYNQINLERMF